MPSLPTRDQAEDHLLTLRSDRPTRILGITRAFGTSR